MIAAMGKTGAPSAPVIGATSADATAAPPAPVYAVMPVDYYETRSDGGYAWYVHYELAFDGSAFNVTTKIDLTGAPATAYLQVWESGIERIWNGKASLTDGAGTYPIRFDVAFMDGADADYQVAVHDGYGGFDMLNWYLSTPWGPGYQDEQAAHEYGHMIGNFDEYVGGATYAGGVTSGTLMADLSEVVPLRYFTGIDAFAEQLVGHRLDVVPYAQVPAPSQTPVPSQPVANVVNGTDGSNRLWGTGADDSILARGGNDTVSAGAGNDTVDGGSGKDRLKGEDGDDVLHGGGDGDMLAGDAGADSLYGGDGSDTLWGGSGNDALWGQAGNDILYGEAGADTFHVEAGFGQDRIADFSIAEGDRLSVAAGMTYTAYDLAGAAVFDFGGGDVLKISGLSVAMFDADHLLVG